MDPLYSKRPFLFIALLFGLLIPAGSPPALAEGTPRAEEMQINWYTTSFQAFPSVAVDEKGEFVVTWTSWGSFGNDTSYTGVQAGWLFRYGMFDSKQLQVNTYTTWMQSLSEVAVAPGGETVVTWSSLGSDGSDDDSYSVQARRYNGSGGELGAPFQVNGYTTDRQCCSAVAVTPSGEFIVAWASNGSDGDDDSNSSVQARRYDADGTPLGAELQVNTFTTGDQGSAAVAADPSGGFVVAWASAASGGTDTDSTSVHARRFDASGLPLGAGFQINDFTTGPQGRPRVATAPDGGFVAVWESVGSAGGDSDSSSIQARMFDASGIPLGPETQVNEWTTGAQERPVVTADARGFVVVWQSDGSFGTDTDRQSVQKREYLWSGTPTGGELQVNTYTSGAQSEPSIAADPYGDFVISWQSLGSAGTDTASTSVQARIYDAILRDDFETGDTARWTLLVP